MNKFISHIFLPLLVVGGAVAAAGTMMDNAKVAETTLPPEVIAEVEVTRLAVAKAAPRVLVNGVAEATRSLNLTPLVEGPITYVSDALVEGGRIRSGSLLLKIDPSTYKIALAQAQAELARAQADLQLELGRARSATKEWEQFGSSNDEQAKKLASRAPQLVSAKALVALRSAQMDRAELDLKRTSLYAPFNALVGSEQVELGQVVTRGSALCTLVASDEVWVRTPVDLHSLSLLSQSNNAKDFEGQTVTVTVPLGAGRTVAIEGKVLRLAGTVDTQTRKAEVLVAVPNPPGRTPLLPGTFVSVQFQASQGIETLQIPRRAVVEGDRIWVVTPSSRLQRLAPEILWTDSDDLFADPASFKDQFIDGVVALVSKPLAGALNGMQVQIAKPQTKASND